MTPPRPPLESQLSFSLYAASIAINRTYKPMLDQLGLTFPQYLVLNALWEQDALTVSAIADRLGLDSSMITPLLKRLESIAVVTKARNPKDERQVIVSLTDKGRSLEMKSAGLTQALLERSGMTAERLIQLNDQVQELIDALDRS